MRYLAALFLLLLFRPGSLMAAAHDPIQGTGVAPAEASGRRQTPTAALADAVRDLLTAASEDFHADTRSAPPHPIRFRDVHLRHVTSPRGQAQYVLCGDFMPAHDPSSGWAAWLRFVTVNTRRYGQWTGSHADALCQRSSPIPEQRGDLSSSLQRIYDARR